MPLISQLPEASALSSTDVIPIVQSGVTKKVTVHSFSLGISGVTGPTGITGVTGVTGMTGATGPNVSVIIMTLDGGGDVITVGIKGYVVVPYNCTINSVTVIGDQTGSIVVDIWKIPFSTSLLPTVANSIVALLPPTISTAKASQNTILTGWTTTISANDELGFNVNSCTSITRATLTLKVTKT